MRFVKKILIFILAAIPVLLLVHILIHTILFEKEATTPSGLEYTNRKWSYSIELSNDWKRTLRFISQVIWLTNVIEFSNEKADLSLQISWNEFLEEDSKNLMKFVQDDAKYGEQNQQIITKEIEEISRTNEQWMVKWQGQDIEGGFIQYYISDELDPENDIIHKLYFSSKEPFTDPQKFEVNKALNSFKMIRPSP